MNDYLCTTCLSSNIKILVGDDAIDQHGDYKEMDLYCYDCKSEDYKISKSYVKQNKSFFKGIEYLYYNNS
jgi:Zn finger protein HypA/HybF involved in hydrogenase expression|tara:strand:+ start:359 stop:568 length:210 start_codon:yes stop_codon:yes gene_type:complete